MADPDEEDLGSRLDNQSTHPSQPPPYRPIEPLAAQTPRSINIIPTIPTIPDLVENIKADIVRAEQDESLSDTETLNSADLVLSSDDEVSEVDGSIEKNPGAGGELPPLKNSSFMNRRTNSPSHDVEVLPQPPPYYVEDKISTAAVLDDDENVNQKQPQMTIATSWMDVPVPRIVSMEDSESRLEMPDDADFEEVERSESAESLMSRLVRQLLCCTADDGPGTSASLDPAIRQQVDDELRRRYYTGI